MSIFQNAKFLLSAPKYALLPPDDGQEIAVIGRSNSGKSTLINTITRQKKLARVGKTPGVTQMLNVFTTEKDTNLRLIDLPGYGFSKASAATRKKWHALIWEYLTERKSLALLLILMDVRHPLNPIDREILEFAIYNKLPTRIILTKADKLKRGARQQTLLKIKNLIKPHKNIISVQLFSAVDKIGIEELNAAFDSVLAS